VSDIDSTASTDDWSRSAVSIPRPGTASQRKSRATASLALLVMSLATFFLTILDVHDALRFVFGIAVGLLVPGWSIIGLLKLNNAPLEFSLSIGASLAILMSAAQIMITIGEWHLAGLEMVTCLACAPSLLWQSKSLWQPAPPE